MTSWVCSRQIGPGVVNKLRIFRSVTIPWCRVRDLRLPGTAPSLAGSNALYLAEADAVSGIAQVARIGISQLGSADAGASCKADCVVIAVGLAPGGGRGPPTVTIAIEAEGDGLAEIVRGEVFAR